MLVTAKRIINTDVRMLPGSWQLHTTGQYGQTVRLKLSVRFICDVHEWQRNNSRMFSKMKTFCKHVNLYLTQIFIVQLCVARYVSFPLWVCSHFHENSKCVGRFISFINNKCKTNTYNVPRLMTVRELIIKLLDSV